MVLSKLLNDTDGQVQCLEGQQRGLLFSSAALPRPLLKAAKVIVLLALVSSGYTVAANCPPLPDINQYNQASQWQQLLNTWLPEQKNCLRNSRYFSTIGAAQLNLGQFSEALLSLERALLLDADNGSAMIDYTQALFQNGKLFAAIDLNQQLQQRTDLPEHLLPLLNERAQAWQALTRRHITELAITTGYNSNLNNAPDLQTLDVTLNGQQGRLALSDRSKEVGGGQANMILAQRYEWFSAEQLQSVSLTFDGRRSQDTRSDQQRITAQYINRRVKEQGVFEWDGRINYVHFGGKALYSDTEVGSQFEWNQQGNTACRPLIKGRFTYRHFYQDDANDGVLIKAGGGVRCAIGEGLLSFTLEHTENIALKQRAGDNRRGPSAELLWQQPLFAGVMSSGLQLNYSLDSQGYSSLLNNNEKRHILYGKWQFNYRQPINKTMAWTVAASVTQQRSNLELFQQKSHRLDMGLEWRF